jgi:hypothetical protein
MRTVGGRRRPTSGLGLLLILVGLVTLAVSLFKVSPTVYRFWPLILVGVGVLGITRRPGWLVELDVALGPEVARVANYPRRIFSWILVIVGLFILPFNLQILPDVVIGPALLIGLGGFLIWRRSR